MMNLRTHIIPFAFMLFSGSAALGQTEDPREQDSARVYRLGEVVVTDDSLARVQPATVQTIGTATINRTDAPTAAGVAYQIPAARIQTNSRGESLLYMRNAGERQISLFFDGALLNVPWDNRVDLSLVPINAVGGITVSKGVPSVLYGANVIGGAVNIATQELRNPGFLTDITVQGGNGGFINGSATHLGMIGDLNYAASVGYTTRDGIPLPADASLPFNQTDTKLRTNTDATIMNAFVQGEYHLTDATRLGLSANIIDAEKGVAPEGHVEDARFWRYSLWRNITVIANGSTDFGSDGATTLTGALWGTSFQQNIDQFVSAAYNLRESTEEDDDMTLGGRGVFRLGFDNGAISLALNGLQSTHEQVDLAYDSTGTLIPFTDTSGNVAPYPTMTYRQQTFSLGLEIERRFGDFYIMTGTSLDGMSTPETGDKPPQETFLDYSLMSGMTYDLTSSLTPRFSLGRKTRFPTMRELYGEALNRFLINPDLKPEEALVGELGVEGNHEEGSYSVVGFLNHTVNTIDQRNIDTLGRRRRQRINLPGSRVLGVELSGSLAALHPFRLDGHFTYAHARGRGTSVAGEDSTFLLSEKPDILATLTAAYEFPFGLHASAELVHNGTAYTLNDDNEFEELAPSTTINARIAYRIYLPIGTGSLAHIFVRANNLTDAVVLPQLGLPSSGREIQAGVKVSI